MRHDAELRSLVPSHLRKGREAHCGFAVAATAATQNTAITRPATNQWYTTSLCFCVLLAGMGVGLYFALRPSSTSSTSSTSLMKGCPPVANPGWYMYDDVVCYHEAVPSRRQLLVGSVYRSLDTGEVPSEVRDRFNNAYWFKWTGVTRNQLFVSSFDLNCTEASSGVDESFEIGCNDYFWERVNENNSVTAITNPKGVSIVDKIAERLQGTELWGKLDFCSAAINTDEARTYIRQFPTVLTNLSANGTNIFNALLESHLMLCNVIEYPYWPDMTVRGSVDGSRLYNVFVVTIRNNIVYYTGYGCDPGFGRQLTPRYYQPVYLVLLTQLYTKYISQTRLDVTLDYSPQAFPSYPNIIDIPCVDLTEGNA